MSGHPVTDEVANAARRLLGANPDEGATSKDVAERACRACEQLAIHLARLIGDTGIRSLFRRSVVLASAHHPWLAKGSTAPETGARSEPFCSSLRGPMEQQDPETAIDGFAAVLATFVGLLDRLIGERLVRRL